MGRGRISLAAARLGLILSAVVAIAADSTPAKEPAAAADWLKHANTLMDVRAPGAAPFHLKVTFHAYPGMDFFQKK
jgi:hypothetical protein